MSESYITYKNSFNSGDLITMMPGMQKMYMGTGKKAIIYQRLNLPANYGHDDSHPIKDETDKNVCMNRTAFEMIKPLIEFQEYVESYNIWAGEKVDVDFDLTRHHAQSPLPNGSIHHWVFLIFPQMECNLSIPWLSVTNGNIRNNLIIINRTARYNNVYIDYFFLKDHQDKVIFAGTDVEHKMFCEQFKLSIPLLVVKDFLELAQSISSCRFFLGGQSMCWHMADAMKSKRILEVCTVFPNTFPTGENGNSFLTQNSLEYKFNKLLKETE